MASVWHASVRFLIRQNINKIKARHHRLLCQRDVQTQTSNSGTAAESAEGDDYAGVDKKEIRISCGKYANLADGCAVAELGGTAVMATVVGTGQPTSLDIPLSVHYQQKAAAIGRIPTNFLRREVGITDSEILISRVIDRSLRPLFEPGNAIETQVICNPLALDGSNFPEVLAINAASAALACSDIPWGGPVAAARVALIDNDPIIHPTKLELAESSLNLIVTSMRNNLVVMIEGSCNNVQINDIQRCIRMAMKSCKQVLQVIEGLERKHKKKERILERLTIPVEVKEKIKNLTEDRLTEILMNFDHNKKSRDKAIAEVYQSCATDVKNELPDLSDRIFSSAFFLNLKELYKSLVISTDKRCDGRGVLDMREITCETGLYEALHGSAVFQRGQTQVFCTVALDSPNSGLRMDRVSVITSGVKEKNFFVHYEFPPYATGEVGTPKRRNRREIGHGNLAEIALKSAVPKFFPFTIRLSSEVLESNGSSSMATVCGGTMALLDAGIPLQFEVAGVAMGLLTSMENGAITNHCILTDIMGMEDYLGDMDFKIAGTKQGFTAMQLDMKVPGLPIAIVYQALTQAKKAFTQIFKSMNKVIQEPRSESKANWPLMKIITVPPHVRAKFIGFGGSNVKKLELEVGVELTEMENGKYSIFAVNKAAMEEALQKIDEIMSSQKEPNLEFGGVYTATVAEIKDGGCFVTLYPNMTPAFIPTSQLDVRRVQHPSALGLEVGCQFQVKYFGRDPVSGAMRLSRKVLLSRNDPH